MVPQRDALEAVFPPGFISRCSEVKTAVIFRGPVMLQQLPNLKHCPCGVGSAAMQNAKNYELVEAATQTSEERLKIRQ